MHRTDSLKVLEETPSSSPAVSWPRLTRLAAQLAADLSAPAWRELLREAHEELKSRFLAEEPVVDLVHARAALIDAVLREAWRSHCLAYGSWALVAGGGHERGAVYPSSGNFTLLLFPHSPD